MPEPDAQQTSRSRKQAVVVVHGMGEQVPMDTLRGFVDTVWTTDDSLIERDRPDADTGIFPRGRNAVWSKPDPEVVSYELRRMTTESTTNGWRTDFYEYYWAHLMHGTTWDHVQGWLWGLMWRNPFTRVPSKVLAVWLLIWLVAALVVAVMVYTAVPQLREFLNVPLWVGLLVAAFIAITPYVVREVFIKSFGDVARYVKAHPPNVARRQEIRENGVALLDRLIASGQYERIVVVAHSLGTIVALDMLNHCFSNHNKTFDRDKLDGARQPERAKLEQMVRVQLGLEDGTPPEDFTAAYQAQQARALEEWRALGNPWNITDFVTLGSPLTHAEFLIADDLDDLRDLQQRRVVPSCPPTLEFDRSMQRRFFTYRSGWLRGVGDNADPDAPRYPHHGAVFAFTRWTNLFSPSQLIVKGDMISGKVAGQFAADLDGKRAEGARDIPVLTEGLITHTHYWNGAYRVSTDAAGAPPYHVRRLREVLDLNSA